jgi:RNA 3'-terminal phosphate cyclase (ATP)
MLVIDGQYGEGGGQVLRTALTLSCITRRPITIENIRAGRHKPGLRRQHLTAVMAAADICDAEVAGADIGSQELVFAPRRPAHAGYYEWQVKSAGAATLVLQTILLPMAMAPGASEIRVIGGTHVPYSPSGHYLRDVYAPMLVQGGVEVFVNIERYGWNPKGGGEITCYLEGWSQLHSQDLLERGDLERLIGVGLASRLPAHIPQRMTTHVRKVLDFLEVPVDIRPERDGRSKGEGAGVFLTAEYANGRAGFSALGEPGVASEEVAEEAAYAFQVFDAGNASVDAHLADQLVLVLALAEGESVFITPQITDHLTTNCWVIQQFLERQITIDQHTGRVDISA